MAFMQRKMAILLGAHRKESCVAFGWPRTSFVDSRIGGRLSGSHEGHGVHEWKLLQFVGSREEQDDVERHLSVASFCEEVPPNQRTEDVAVLT